MQSRKHSLLEAITNIAAGFSISWLLTFFVLPAYGYKPSMSQATSITLIFTVASIIRSYVLRRLFNHLSASSATPKRVSYSPLRKTARRAFNYLVVSLTGLSGTLARLV